MLAYYYQKEMHCLQCNIISVGFAIGFLTAAITNDVGDLWLVWDDFKLAKVAILEAPKAGLLVPPKRLGVELGDAPKLKAMLPDSPAVCLAYIGWNVSGILRGLLIACQMWIIRELSLISNLFYSLYVRPIMRLYPRILVWARQHTIRDHRAAQSLVALRIVFQRKIENNAARWDQNGRNASVFSWWRRWLSTHRITVVQREAKGSNGSPGFRTSW